MNMKPRSQEVKAMGFDPMIGGANPPGAIGKAAVFEILIPTINKIDTFA